MIGIEGIFDLLVDQGSFKPESDTDIPFAIQGIPVFWDDRIEKIKAQKGNIAVFGIAMMIGKSQFAGPERRLNAAAEFYSSFLCRDDFQPLWILVPVQSPQPDVAVVDKIVTHQ